MTARIVAAQVEHDVLQLPADLIDRLPKSLQNGRGVALLDGGSDDPCRHHPVGGRDVDDIGLRALGSGLRQHVLAGSGRTADDTTPATGDR